MEGSPQHHAHFLYPVDHYSTSARRRRRSFSSPSGPAAAAGSALRLRSRNRCTLTRPFLDLFRERSFLCARAPAPPRALAGARARARFLLHLRAAAPRGSSCRSTTVARSRFVSAQRARARALACSVRARLGCMQHGPILSLRRRRARSPSAPQARSRLHRIGGPSAVERREPDAAVAASKDLRAHGEERVRACPATATRAAAAARANCLVATTQRPRGGAARSGQLSAKAARTSPSHSCTALPAEAARSVLNAVVASRVVPELEVGSRCLSAADCKGTRRAFAAAHCLSLSS
jgi:hypothetical protein